MEAKKLPRLLYIGDVAVDSTVGGEALIYRLLQKYPVSHLRIVEGNIASSTPEKRLENVVYERFEVGSKRLLHSRVVYIYTTYLYWTARSRSEKFKRIVKEFQPEAILTVAHGLSWLTAASLAAKFKLPLHLIIHDDWLTFTPLLQKLKDSANKQFGDVYRQAMSRLCVSPYMVECYEQRYGVMGSVLYPSRAADVPEFERPPDRHKPSPASLIFAYAGSLHHPGYASTLVALASVLESLGDSLIIYSALTEESIKRIGLNKSNVIIRPLIPYQKLISTLRNEADVLFVPMSFEPAAESNMKLSFPSKLTDYTATGLPLLIWGPPYCSAVRWAQSNPGVAEVVDESDVNALARAVKKLKGDPEYRLRLGTNALTKGREYFSHATGIQEFYQAIIQKSSLGMTENSL